MFLGTGGCLFLKNHNKTKKEVGPVGGASEHSDRWQLQVLCHCQATLTSYQGEGDTEMFLGGHFWLPFLKVREIHYDFN